MYYFKGKSIYVLCIFLFIALFLPRPRLVFSQISEFDTNAPYIVQTSPEDTQTDVSINTSIKVIFNEFMDTALTNNSFSITPYIDGQFFWELDQTLIFSPDMLLNYSEYYQVSIDTQAADFFGNSLENPYQWYFVTESSPWLHFFDIQGLYLDQNNVQTILGVDNGDIWVVLSSSGSSDDLFIFNGFDPTDFQKVEEPLGQINALAQDSGGNIWVASESDIPDLGGIHAYNGKDWIHYNSGNSDLSDNAIKCLTIDSDDNVWAGSSYSGIYRFDGASWTNFNMDNSYLSDNLVTAIVADETDRIWVATVFGGIESFEDPDIIETWDNHTSIIESQLGISLTYTNKLVSGSGKIWAGTDSGLLSFDFGMNQWELFTQADVYPLEDSLTSLAWDSLNNELYIGTFYGVITFDGTNWDTLVLGDDIGPEALEIAMDIYGNKWIGTSNSLSRYDINPPSLSSFTPSDNKKDVSKTSKIVLIFSEPVNRSSVLSALSIKPSISFSSSWDTHSTKLTLTPKTNLKSNTQYKVTLSKAATDIQGHPLAEDYSWSFRTKKSTTPTYTGTLFQYPTSGFAGFQYPTSGFAGFQYPTSGFAGFQYPSLNRIGGFIYPRF